MHAADDEYHVPAILDRIFSQDTGGMTRPAAEALLALHFPPSDIDRMNELAEKNRADRITPQERSEMEQYLEVGHLLDFVRLDALRFLKQNQL